MLDQWRQKQLKLGGKIPNDGMCCFQMQALQDKQKHIDNAKKYVAQQDTSWWHVHN